MDKETPKSEALFHYTTAEGLEGVLKSKSLRATHYISLNDEQEILYFYNYYRQAIYKKMPPSLSSLFGAGSLSHNERIETVISVWQSILLGEKNDASPLAEPFLVSFCHSNDDYVYKNGLLGQWRGYGKDGGYAIEFKASEIQELIKGEKDYTFLELIPVVYKSHENEHEDFVKDFAQLLNVAEILNSKNTDEEFKEQLRKHMGESWKAFVRCMGRFKHQAFLEEREERIIACPYQLERKDDSKIQICAKRGGLVPYINLFNNLPIKRIIVGPHPNKKRRSEQLQAYLKDKIEVTISEIPYTE